MNLMVYNMSRNNEVEKIHSSIFKNHVQMRMPSLSIFTYSESYSFFWIFWCIIHYGEGTTSQETFQYSLDKNTKIAAANHDRRSDTSRFTWQSKVKLIELDKCPKTRNWIANWILAIFTWSRIRWKAMNYSFQTGLGMPRLRKNW